MWNFDYIQTRRDWDNYMWNMIIQVMFRQPM